MPTIFGEKYAEGWGPLDSTVVEANLLDLDPPPGPEQPYDSRPNTDQEWSDGCVDAGDMNNNDPASMFINRNSTSTYGDLSYATSQRYRIYR